MVMRPYQIAATERILLRIKQATMNKWQGTIRAGGYIWHTTGSGKTLTSFKTAQLASKLPYVDKVLFVVDRKDLDYQTMKEYDNFEKGCANSNTSSNILQKQLNDPHDGKKIIITTIQSDFIYFFVLFLLCHTYSFHQYKIPSRIIFSLAFFAFSFLDISTFL
jgi:type I restriction enzyme R subunit